MVGALASRDRVWASRVGLRRLPQCLKALGRNDLPTYVEHDGVVYRRVGLFKHDFFAATGLYEAGERRVVLKAGRREPFLGIPLAWAGRLLARHEADQLRRLADIEGIPALIGVWGGDVLIREYVPGHELAKGERVDDQFFPRLAAMLDAIHRRGMAYVDLEKPQNVLVGDDGRPHLIDFQISWPWPIGPLARTWPGRWLGRRLQEGDRYHFTKLRRRFRRDQLAADELTASYTRPWPVRLHRRLTAPATRFRRWVLAQVDPARKHGERGRIDETTRE